MKINMECFTLWDDDFQPSLPVKMSEGKIIKILKKNLILLDQQFYLLIGEWERQENYSSSQKLRT